jgi:hypothetical protein
MRMPLSWVVVLGGLLPPAVLPAADIPPQFDVVVYGGTSGGITAAIQTRRMGKTVVLIEPRRFLGGLTTSGLGATDSGNKAVIGGMSREFYQRVKRAYDDPARWTREDCAKYSGYRPNDDAMWTFEPHVAEEIYAQMLQEAKVPVLLGVGLESVSKRQGRIVSITTTDGKVIGGRQFIDATYEGDLLAAAGVSYTVGREANSTYGETLNGVQTARAKSHQFVKPVDPYVRPGDPSNGLLPGVNASPGEDGQADHRVQAYNYRLCFTDVRENQIPFEKPEGYDPLQYELLLRNFEAGDLRVPLSIHMMPNRKTDNNNNFAVSSDWIGMNYGYPAGTPEERAKFERDLETYTRGLMWTLANHPRVPEEVRSQVGRWGWAKDEWAANNHWPYWPYVREARRMIGVAVHTELDCTRQRPCPDPVGMGSYNMDSHNCQRHVDATGHVRNEGDIQVSPRGPYLISYRNIVPKPEDCTNLLVPVCLSSSHIAYGSIRMEPVFMILGQSAATAACLAIDAGIPVQSVDYAALRKQLDADGQVVTIPVGSTSAAGVDPKTLPGIVVDDAQAKTTGDWSESNSIGGFVGAGYVHDGNAGQGNKSIRFELPIAASGEYEVRLAYTPNANRATNVPVLIEREGARDEARVNQRKSPPIDRRFVSIGTYRFTAAGPNAVTVSNAGADGYVVADAVQLVPVPP